MLDTLLRSSVLTLVLSLACATPQYRALHALVDAPLTPAPRYDALGSTAPLTPSVEQWALYEEIGPSGRVLLTAVLQPKESGQGWRVELTRRSAQQVERHYAPVKTSEDPFLAMQPRGAVMVSQDRVVLPAGQFVGAMRQDDSIYHPRVPIHGLLQGHSERGYRWKLLRFGLDRPPTAR